MKTRFGSCACPCADARDCWNRRYPRDPDAEFGDRDDGPCECPCHEELACEAIDEDWP